jgi:hypothetical protein
MYFLRPEIKEDPRKRWSLPDRIFFGHGACHILAGVHLLEFANSGFSPVWLRPARGFSGNHIFLRGRDVAFDFRGYSRLDRLLAHHHRGWSAKFPGWSATVEEVDFDLLDTTELNARGMRGPDQYLHDPIPRAQRFIRRIRHRHLPRKQARA